MKLKFDPNLDYQLEAIQSVVDIFEGQPLGQSDFEVSLNDRVGFITQTELGIGNRLSLDKNQILENVRVIQERNQIERVPELQAGDYINGMNFTTEMETGTGKTYVYLRSVFELNQKYGFKKFIIVVPSVAIREGVYKNLEITKEHFSAVYNNPAYRYFIYDSSRISNLRQFAGSNQLEIMIINIDSFNKDTNVMFKEMDQLNGRAPIEFVSSTNPVVIMDEPQNMEQEASRNAISNLNPLCTLRYSATHRSAYNLVYKLDPVTAFERGLVKKIEVASVVAEDSYHAAFIKVRNIKLQGRHLKAYLTIHKDTNSGPRESKVTVTHGDDLFEKSNERTAYQNGYIISEINVTPGREFIRFSNGLRFEIGTSQGGLTDEVMQAQIRNTIEEHLEKEIELKGRGIKVLSLFFIDKVANYREYDARGNAQPGKIARWFVEEYEKLIRLPRYKDVIPFPLSKIHDGYFAVDKQNRLKDSWEGRDVRDDESAYNLIMKDKERLLSEDEPLRFIFSHSALREGWDNPNVFQICTLNESGSEIKKRQEIGRGLRIPVNQNGDRVFDERINRVTIIANESYDDFAAALQTEYEEIGIKFGMVPKSEFSDLAIDGNVLGADQSNAIWNHLVSKGFLNSEGAILSSFKPENDNFTLELDEKYQTVEAEIIDGIRKYEFSRRIENKKKRRTLSLNKQVYLDEDFKMLWDKINKKTRYRVNYHSATLIEKCVKEISDIPEIDQIKLYTYKTIQNITRKGVDAQLVGQRIEEVQMEYKLPDIVAYIQRETELTRSTIVEILKQTNRLHEFLNNPQRFMDEISSAINRTLRSLVAEGIQYEKVEGQIYEMRRFEKEELISYLNRLQPVSKSVYDAVEFDSEVEKRFAQQLDKRKDIKLFVKLPRQFKIDTPIGPYNPDWAIVKHDKYGGQEKVYMVKETKGSVSEDQLRIGELAKIKFGRAHFNELGIDYGLVGSANEV